MARAFSDQMSGGRVNSEYAGSVSEARHGRFGLVVAYRVDRLAR